MRQYFSAVRLNSSTDSGEFPTAARITCMCSHCRQDFTYCLILYVTRTNICALAVLSPPMDLGRYFHRERICRMVSAAAAYYRPF